MLPFIWLSMRRRMGSSRKNDTRTTSSSRAHSPSTGQVTQDHGRWTSRDEIRRLRSRHTLSDFRMISHTYVGQPRTRERVRGPPTRLQGKLAGLDLEVVDHAPDAVH